MSRAPKQARAAPSEHPKPAQPNTTVHHVNHCPAPFTYIGRATGPHAASLWANPHRIAHGTDRAQAVARFQSHAESASLVWRIRELRNQRLACWCSPHPCHGDFLASLANALWFDGQPCPRCTHPVQSSPIIAADRIQVTEYWRCTACRAYGFQKRGAVLNHPETEQPTLL